MASCRHLARFACSPSALRVPKLIPKPVSTSTGISCNHVPNMDKADQALAHGVLTSIPSSYRAVADHSGVPYSTLYQRARGRQSIEAKAQGQQYLAPFEEKAVVDFVLHMAELVSQLSNVS